MRGEIGEAIDIIKKHGGEKASQDTELRKQLIEELVDVHCIATTYFFVMAFHPKNLEKR